MYAVITFGNAPLRFRMYIFHTVTLNFDRWL